MKKHFFLILSIICLFSIHSSNKWIVVTTINYPTPALKKLASLPDWNLVVVGDTKTPSDWHLDNCHFLNADDQVALNYEIHNYLPWNHYCRKNIGYLYAIENGAEIIYETDDDNELYNEIYCLPKISNIRSFVTKSPAVNVYGYFGQPKIWPRGFPLKLVRQKAPDTYEIKPSKVYIQQGLADGDPDVDAIYRCINEKGNVYRLLMGKEIYFDNQQPPIVLPKKTFCPFNSQNTLFYQEAFWGLIIPITTTFRVCDIWRGYWVQRMLWELDANLCFTPASVFQDRNEHNLYHDLSDEIDLYTRSESLIHFLNSWRSSKNSLEEKIFDLIDALVKENYFKEKESELMKAWINDLKRIGYRFPSN